MPIFNKLLRINSSDRLAGTATDFSLNFTNVQMLGKVVSVVVKHVSFPNVFYNIRTGINDIFIWENKTTVNTYGIIIPAGIYTVDSLEAKINELALALDTNFYVQYVPTLFRFEFRYTNPTDVVEIKSASQGSLLSPTLGIDETVTYTSEYISEGFVKLQGVEHVYIRSINLSKGNNMVQANKRQEVPVVAMIPNNQPFGNIVHYETKHEKLDVINYNGLANLNEIDIKLTDADDNVLDLQNQDVNIVLKVYYEV